MSKNKSELFVCDFTKLEEKMVHLFIHGVTGKGKFSSVTWLENLTPTGRFRSLKDKPIPHHINGRSANFCIMDDLINHDEGSTMQFGKLQGGQQFIFSGRHYVVMLKPVVIRTPEKMHVYNVYNFDTGCLGKFQDSTGVLRIGTKDKKYVIKEDMTQRIIEATARTRRGIESGWDVSGGADINDYTVYTVHRVDCTRDHGKTIICVIIDYSLQSVIHREFDIHVPLETHLSITIDHDCIKESKSHCGTHAYHMMQYTATIAYDALVAGLAEILNFNHDSGLTIRNKEEEPKMNNTHRSHVLTLLQTDMTTVDVHFPDGNSAKDYTYMVTHERANQLQTMLSKAEELGRPGPAVVVSKGNGYKIAVVSEVHETDQIDITKNYDYKWIVDIIDTTWYEEQMNREKQARQLLKTAERNKERTNLLENLGFNNGNKALADDVKKLLNGGVDSSDPTLVDETVGN